MTTSSVLIDSGVRKTIIVDALILVFVYFIPTLSHLLPIPIYYFEPMRVALFVSILLLQDKKNAIFLAISLPLFSYLVAGHPVVIKNLIMAIELTVNVVLLYSLLDKKNNLVISCFISILLSKVLYYVMKYIVITAGFFNSTLVDTSIIVQLFVTIILSVVFGFIFSKQGKKIYG